MEDRLRTLIDFLDKSHAKELAKAKEATTDYLKGYYLGWSASTKLTNLWLRRDILKEVVTGAETEVESTSP